MKREKRVEIANDTLKILKNGNYSNNEGEIIDISVEQRFAEENTRIYLPEELEHLLEKYQGPETGIETNIEVVNRTTLDAVRSLDAAGKKKILLLNFASAKNAGGGFLNGSQAQEESIARASGLYNCLLRAPEYYKVHRGMKSCLYTDNMIYSPGVPIIKDEEGRLLEQPVTAAIITSAAVNAGVVRQREPGMASRIKDVMAKRLDKVLLVSYLNGHETLVLGAWGCGVFQNDPAMIAGLFHEALTKRFKGAFRSVCFAVLDRGGKVMPHFEKLFS